MFYQFFLFFNLLSMESAELVLKRSAPDFQGIKSLKSKGENLNEIPRTDFYLIL